MELKIQVAFMQTVQFSQMHTILHYSIYINPAQLFFLSFELCVGVCAAWRLMYCVIYWGERTTCKLVLFFIHMEKSILSFYHVGFDDQTKVTRLADKHLYLESCISTPLQFHFSCDSSVLPLSFRHNILVESFQMWCSRGIPSRTSLFGKRFVKSY